MINEILSELLQYGYISSVSVKKLEHQSNCAFIEFEQIGCVARADFMRLMMILGDHTLREAGVELRI